MANSKRRENYTDRNGNMLMPINVEGGMYNEHFITTPKLITIVCILLALVYIIYTIYDGQYTFVGAIIVSGLWLFITQLCLRFIVFEERFYYRMYQELKKHEITSPALFWDVASIKDTDEGAIITYSDAKIGIMVKVERDTITGKNLEFKEAHYDAISDFYREVCFQKYSWVQMNIMEQTGKDPRLTELSKIVYKSDNPNIVKLMEMQVGHIKNITYSSLYESDYFLFYTSELSKMDSIISDITECMFKLLDGAFIGYTILSRSEINDFVKEEYGVNYFNSTEASLLMYGEEGNNIIPFTISGLVWTDNEEQNFNNSEINKLKNITSGVIKETVSQSNISLKDTLYRKEEKSKFGIDFTSIYGDDYSTNLKEFNNTISPSNSDMDDGEEYIDF